jgi:glutathione S-transferase
VHPSYQRSHRPERFAEGEAAQAAVKETGRKSFWANCQEIDSMFQRNDWVMVSAYALVDPYALVFYGWGARSGFPMKELSAYTAWQERMMQRPTVRKTVESDRTFRHHSRSRISLPKNGDRDSSCFRNRRS